MCQGGLAPIHSGKISHASALGSEAQKQCTSPAKVDLNGAWHGQVASSGMGPACFLATSRVSNFMKLTENPKVYHHLSSLSSFSSRQRYSLGWHSCGLPRSGRARAMLAPWLGLCLLLRARAELAIGIFADPRKRWSNGNNGAVVVQLGCPWLISKQQPSPITNNHRQ